MKQEEKKQKAAQRAIDKLAPFLNEDIVLGIGTGSTVNYFIEKLMAGEFKLKGLICSSETSKQNLTRSKNSILELNEVHKIDFYIDGADEFNERFELIKGGGGALTREKILANSSEKFICIVDDSKQSKILGEFPLPIEIIEEARSAISREMIKMGGRPVYRNKFITDNGNQIIDVHHLDIKIPFEMEQLLNNIPGVIENGIFSKRPADTLIIASDKNIKVINKS